MVTEREPDGGDHPSRQRRLVGGLVIAGSLLCVLALVLSASSPDASLAHGERSAAKRERRARSHTGARDGMPKLAEKSFAFDPLMISKHTICQTRELPLDCRSNPCALSSSNLFKLVCEESKWALAVVFQQEHMPEECKGMSPSACTVHLCEDSSAHAFKSAVCPRGAAPRIDIVV